MKRLSLIVMIVCGMLQLNAQQIGSSEQINHYGLIIDEEFFESIPEMELTRDAELKNLPNSVDNSTRIYMPPIFHQRTSASCVQCAEIGYVLTYELNRYRNVPAGTSWSGNGQENINLYHPFFTYNFLNGGNHATWTSTGSGFNIVKEIGCPSLIDFYDPILQDLSNTKSSKYWMSGVDKYINASESNILYQNEVSPFKITWSTTYNSLDNLKHWLSDHNSNSGTGGLAIISVFTDNGYYTSYIPSGSPESGKKMVTSWGTSGGHALTIVGYNDDIHCFDLNNDGIYENVDSNGNGKIDLSECEKGAFKIANSWGKTSPSTTNGYVYVPYKLVEPGVIRYHRAYSCHATEPKEKELFIGFSLSHPIRENVRLGVGVNNDIYNSTPNDLYQYNYAFNYNGGGYPMNGDIDNPQPIDIALSLGDKLDISNSKRFFIRIYDKEFQSSNGAYISNLQLIDHRWGEKFVINKPGRIYTTSATTLLSIDYDLIPFVSSIKDYVCSNDKFMRREVNVDNGIFEINNGVNIGMYGTEDFDCVLNINENSSLIIHDNVEITAQQGDCKIIINGDVIIGNNVTFTAKSGATLKVIVNNNNNFSIANCIFDNANLELNHTSEVNSPNNIISNASVTNCSFSAKTELSFAIKINNYDTYSINNNTIYGRGFSTQRFFNDGILVYYSGTSTIGNVNNNNIEGCLNSGLTLYSSNANVKLNKITKCEYGVKLLNMSTINDFMGRCSAMSSSETQYIHDNDNGEVYVYRGCMPERFLYNTITNSNDASLVIYDGRGNLTSATYSVLNVEYNNWGTLSDSEIKNKLTYITDNNNVVNFDYKPRWSYGFCPSEHNDSLVARTLFADSLLDAGNYGLAKAEYRNIISEYPISENAVNSMKKLLIAENAYGNDYESLQSYYNNDTTISSNENLNILAGTLSNKCDENMKNYDKAIEWYENVIEDESTPYNDSIFATIDLGNLYLKMESCGTRGIEGRLRQFIPNSAEAHAENTDNALRQLKTDNNIKSSSPTLPEVFWTDIVTSQPEGYVVDDNGVIHIHTAEALAWLSAVSNGMHGNEPTGFEGIAVILENDIDLAEAKWTPIAEESSFMGVFDGNGYTIYSTILADNKKGFFNKLTKADVKNVIFRKSQVHGKWQWGGFLAYEANASVIDRCFVECDYLLEETGRSSSPFINAIYKTIVSNCMLYIPNMLQVGTYLGIEGYGIGFSYDSSHIYNCGIIIDKAHIEFSNDIGFVYQIDKNCKMENCYIHIREFADYPGGGGGFAPRNGIATFNRGLIRNCYFNRDIYAEDWNPNIIPDFDNEAVGDNDGIVENAFCYFNENDYWQLNESIVYNENTTDNLLEAMNLGADILIEEGYSCLKWGNTGMDFDNIGLPVFEKFNNMININEYKKDVVSIYPNPASDFVRISSIGSQPSVVRVFNCLGMLIEELEMNSEEIEINTASYNNGVYFVRVDNGSSVTVNRVVISK
ncbi:MAG: T9SS type A sorting domain-containing protein [Bacteroidales bacterium]|nr:T9SS type A sorting domain-containing protein [Bacteroidales bacterium]